jgi:hypothetical protein
MSCKIAHDDLVGEYQRGIGYVEKFPYAIYFRL